MKKSIISVIFIMLTLNLFSQTFKGKVTYRAKIINIDSTKLKTPQQQKKYAHVMHTYEFINKLKLQLIFDNENSYFHCIDNLIQEGENEFLYKTATLISKTRSNYFYTKKNKQLVDEKESLGDHLFISKNINIKDWKLLNDTKRIGKYLCYKAIKEINIETVKGNKKVNQIAWYTPEIPITFGPKEFVGFPGLVLQAIYGNIQYTATEIILNPNENISVKKNNKKTISEVEYKKILQKSIDNTNSFFLKKLI